MPALVWEGKDAAVNAARKISARLLEFVPSSSCGDADNLIVHGDNLPVLTSLLPRYRQAVKCIYIDPPYNTGSAFDTYNDNFEHAAWLNFMYPRLELLKEFLTDDGAIFISIDDNEQAHLKIICDEIFGAKNFIAQFNWRRRSGANDALSNVSLDHEYITCYAKDAANFTLNGVEKDFANYTNPDNDPRGAWTRGDLTCGKTAAQRPNLFYPITDPTTGITYQCNPNRVWSFEPDKMRELIATGKVLFPPNGKGRPAYKRHKSEVRSERKPFSSIIETQLNSMATRELRDIFGEQVFDYPKTVNLIQQIVGQATDKDSIVLDAFAGSGTTAHAVINLNAADGGNRKFILIEERDYCETITAERVRRVGGSFQFARLGEEIFLSDGTLNRNVTDESLARFVWLKATGTVLTEKFSLPLIGVHAGAAIYLLRGKILTRRNLAGLPVHDGAKIIYGAACRLEDEFLRANKIEFRPITKEILWR